MRKLTHIEAEYRDNNNGNDAAAFLRENRVQTGQTWRKENVSVSEREESNI